MTLGEKIKELRKEKGLSIKELSDLSGLTTVSISNYENDKRTPNPVGIYKLSKALNCDYDELYNLIQ